MGVKWRIDALRCREECNADIDAREERAGKRRSSVREAQGVKRRFSVKRGAGSKTAFQHETPFERTRQRSRENL